MGQEADRILHLFRGANSRCRRAKLSKSSRLWLVLHSKSGVEADLSQLGGSCVYAIRQIGAARMHRRQLCSLDSWTKHNVNLQNLGTRRLGLVNSNGESATIWRFRALQNVVLWRPPSRVSPALRRNPQIALRNLSMPPPETLWMFSSEVRRESPQPLARAG